MNRLFIFVIFGSVHVQLAWAQSSQPAVPDQATQASILTRLKRVYAGNDPTKTRDYDQDPSEQVAAWLKTLESRSTSSTTTYVIQSELIRMSITISDDALLASATDQLCDNFPIHNPLQFKFKNIQAFAKNADNRSEHEILAYAVDVVDESLSRAEYEVAQDLNELALSIARRAKDKITEDLCVQNRKDISRCQGLQEASATAELAIRKDIGDRDANTRAGWYRAFVARQWVLGFSLLALGSDDELADLAQAELKAILEGGGERQLTDSWLALAEINAGFVKRNCLRRALHWLSQELPWLKQSLARVRPLDLLVESNKRIWRFTELQSLIVAARAGMTSETESAVEAALAWLAAHQNRDGSWAWNHTPGDRCSGYANPGEARSKMGATGMALSPFLGAGYTHQYGKYREVVRKGLKYLIGNMIVANNAGRLFEANGLGHEHMYCHGIAACVIADAYAATKDYSLKAPAQLAVNYIVQAQDPDRGGWRYLPRTGGDTSVFSWQMSALKSAILSGLNVPGRVKPLAIKWLDSVQSDIPAGGFGATYGYQQPGDRDGTSSACSAIGLYCRAYLGAKKTDPGLVRGVRLIVDEGPSRNDIYYNYYAANVVFMCNASAGDSWEGWNKELSASLVSSQVKAGNDRGSWYFEGGQGSREGGRIFCTALATLIFEVYYRYPSLFAGRG